MGNVINSIHRINKEDPLNIILLCNNHEKYLSLVCKTGHNFYLWKKDGSPSSWNEGIEKKPENLRVLDRRALCTNFDYIISNDRLEQYNEASELALKFHTPIILIDHCCSSILKPHDVFSDVAPSDPQALLKTPGAVVSLSADISKSWHKNGLDLVIPIGIDTEKFSAKTPDGPDDVFGELSETTIVFDNNVGQSVGQRIFARLVNKPYSVIPTDSDVSNKEEIYQHGSYFINPYKNITTKLLEAMSSENVPICFRGAEMESFIEHGANGFLVDSEYEIAAILEELDIDASTRIAVGKNARDKVLALNSMDNFLSKWKHLLNYMRSQFYTPQ
jgi:predicted transcriptional regulator